MLGVAQFDHSECDGEMSVGEGHMRALFPGAAVGMFIGWIVGRIWERRLLTQKTFVSAGKTHKAAVKAFNLAKKARRGALGVFSVAVLAAFGVLVLLGYVSLMKS
jgi:hypothetical protein